MAVVIESVPPWAPKPFIYLLLFASCFASLFLYPYFSKPGFLSRPTTASSPFDLGSYGSFQRFQRRFLILYSIASLMEGLGSLFGDYDGISRENVALCISVGAAAALLIGPILGIVSDVKGPKTACILFFILHLLMCFLKSISGHPSIWVMSICLALASSVFSFCFETWMIVEHEKQGHRQDMLNDTFWLMFFFESASLVGSQAFANMAVKDADRSFLTLPKSASFLAILSILYINKKWNGCEQLTSIGNYTKSLSSLILNDKILWTLTLAQASIYFSMSVFWILWAPTIVADGRVVHLSLIYPCFLGSRMLGSTVFPWFFSGSVLHNEDYLTTAFAVAGLAFSIVAYDYQEIEVLVTLFCIFHACVGFILPSLARLRTMYIPNQFRGGMISLSLAPANAAFLFVLVLGGYCRVLSNTMIMAFAAFGLICSAGCIHLLQRGRKHSHQNWHKL
ncbi:uncharacterized protein LOC120257643 [Dioscorea cayenensis subsp. rotundata]|uniref:Uncharacterized protein LOC120257643 n=1 Tax=Dioscorea cayennensis subsp. rotundata TaxID=55577 RepID=A0AB40B175_DIOCR|nr:uncharacterized protein LOC120257643 [Dioscorea cayenensis subsp. rotundata]